jgi:hypothetical protein
VPLDLSGLPFYLVATPLERLFRRLFSGGLTVALIAIVCALVTQSPITEGVIFGSILVLIPLAIASSIATLRARRILECSRFHICPSCLAPMELQPGQSRCAACDYAFQSARELESLWRRLYGMPAPAAGAPSGEPTDSETP